MTNPLNRKSWAILAVLLGMTCLSIPSVVYFRHQAEKFAAQKGGVTVKVTVVQMDDPDPKCHHSRCIDWNKLNTAMKAGKVKVQADRNPDPSASDPSPHSSVEKATSGA